MTLQRGHDLPERDREPGDIPILGSFGITGYHDTAKVKGPGVTIGRSGASFGVVSFSSVDYWPLNTALYVTDFHGNDEKFAYYFLGSIDFTRFNSGSAQPSLNRNYIHPLPIKVPKVEDQKAIAAVLSAFDDKIELNRQMNTTLEAMARALFKSWFIDFDPVRRNQAGQPSQPYDHLFPDRLVMDGNGGELPEGWHIETIRDCCERIENGGTPKRNEPNYWEPPTIPWLTSGEVRQSIITETESFISQEGLAKSSAKLWPIGTTVVAMYGATAGETTFLAKELTTNQACCGLIPQKHMRYFNYLLISSSTKTLAGQARGSAQQNLSQGLISSFPAIIPDKNVSEHFDKIVKPLFDKWISNLHESCTLADLRDTLLPRLMSGQLRAPFTS